MTAKGNPGNREKNKDKFRLASLFILSKEEHRDKERENSLP